MIINIRKEISKSFFFIISSLLPNKMEASTQQLVFPNNQYTIYTFLIQSNKLHFIKKIYTNINFRAKIVSYRKKETMSTVKDELISLKYIIKELVYVIKTTNEREDFISGYSSNPNYLEIVENYNLVFKHIKDLKEELGFNTATELTILCQQLIHRGLLSETGQYIYNQINHDLINYQDKKFIFDLSLLIFRGEGCCRHTAAFLQQFLNYFNQPNTLVVTKFSPLHNDYNLAQTRLFLNNYFKEKFLGNHALNYVRDDDISYLIDITTKAIRLYTVGHDDNNLAYPFNSKIGTDSDIVIPLYKYSALYDKPKSFQELQSLDKNKQITVCDNMEDAIIKCIINKSLLGDFYIENKKYYHKINEAYDRIIADEKRLRLK